MKKTLPLIFALTLVCCGFTGCGDNANDSVAEGTDTTMAQSSGADESGTEESMNSATDNDNGLVGDIVTDAESMVDDLVSAGEDIAGDVGDAVMGTDETRATE